MVDGIRLSSALSWSRKEKETEKKGGKKDEEETK